MPIRAEVEGVGVLEFPDGTDPRIIQHTVNQAVQGRYATPSQRRGEDPQARIAAAGGPLTNPLPSVIGNAQRGAIDVLGGGAQLLSRGANAMGLVPESNPGSFFAGPKDVEAQNAQARANVDQWAGPAAPGFNPVRSAASALLTMPLTPTRFLQAPTALERAAGAGVAGGVAGGIQEVQNPKDNADFGKRKLLQTGIGAGAAALTQPVAEFVVKNVIAGLNVAADKGIAGAKNMTGANDMNTLVNMTRESLKKAGLSFDDLSDAAKQGLLDDVQKATAAYSGVSPGAVARQAAFRQEGFDPLRHWVTRDPAEFTALENVSHTDVGNPLKQRKADLDQFVMDRIIGMRGTQQAPEAVGQSATKDLKAYLDQAQGKTNVLYRTFGEIAPDAKGNPQRFVNDVFGGLEGQMAGAALPEGLRNILNQVSQGKIPLTPSTLFQIQKMAKPGADGTTNYALGHLRSAIDREIQAISSDVSPTAPNAADVLKMARGSHAQNMGELEGNRILSQVDEGKAIPENFGDLLFGSSLKELRSTWTKLSPESQQNVRAQVLDDLKTKAFSGASELSGKPANQATFNNYLSDPTNAEKLKTILGDEQFSAVKRYALMLESAHMQPSGSAVNNSKTGGALLTALPRLGEALKAKGIPGGSFVQDSARKGLVESAQYVPPEALGQRSLVIDPMVEEILKRRAGHYAGLLAGGAAFPFTQGLLAP